MVGVSIQIKSYISGDRSTFIDPMLLPSALLSRQGGIEEERESEQSNFGNTTLGVEGAQHQIAG